MSENKLAVIFKCIITLALLLCVNRVFADPASIKVGETDFTPEVHIEYFQSDNAYLTTGDEVPTNGAAVAPTLSWEATQGLTSLAAQYRGNYSNANKLGLDFADHILSLTGSTEFSKRSRVQSELYLGTLHEPIGTGLSFGLGGELAQQNEFTDIRFDLNHTYGAEQARGNLVLGVEYINRAYTNNQNLTQGADRTNINPFATFSLRTSGDTRVFFKAQYSDIDYESDRLDGYSLGTFIGASWKISGRTTGSAQVGQLSREYSNNSLIDKTVAAEASVNYDFNSVSRAQLEFNRSIIGTDDPIAVEVGKEVIATTVQATWWYLWTPRLEQIMSFDSTGKDADCPQIDTIFNQVSINLNYKFRRWLIIGAAFDSGEATGTPCAGVATANPDYGRQNFRIHFDVSL